MADSLLLSGASAFRNFSAGNFAGSGAITCAFILKKVADGAWQNPGGWNALDAHFFINDLNFLVFSEGTNYPIGSTAITVADGWVILAVTKASGAVAPRYHVYKYGTGVWNHAPAPSAVGNLAALTTYRIGLNGQGFQPFGGNVLLDAVWDSVLSDAALEALPLSLAAWVAAAPDELRRYDTAGAVTPLVGTSTQTGQSGGSLAVGDAPAGWDDSLGPPPAAYTGRTGGVVVVS